MPDRTMMTVKMSANGKMLAIAAHDKTTVELWDVATGKQQTLGGNAFSVTALAFSPDGKTLATFWPPLGGGFLAVSGDGQTAALGIGQWGDGRGPRKKLIEVWSVQSLSTTPPKKPNEPAPRPQPKRRD